MIDLNTFKCKNLNFAPQVTQYFQMCKISKDSYFINWGNQYKINENFLLNLSHQNFQTFEGSIFRKTGACICKNEKVYLFGGRTNKELPDCESFDLKTLKWTKISDLPKASGWCSAGETDGKIILSGYYIDKVLLYDEDRYKNLFELPNNSFKVVTNGWVLTKSVLFEFSESKKKWFAHNLALEWNEDNLGSWTTFVRKNFIYFIDIDHNLIRIDTKLKKVERVHYEQN